jgi:hypothetical protein
MYEDYFKVCVNVACTLMAHAVTVESEVGFRPVSKSSQEENVLYCSLQT